MLNTETNVLTLDNRDNSIVILKKVSVKSKIHSFNRLFISSIDIRLPVQVLTLWSRKRIGNLVSTEFQFVELKCDCFSHIEHRVSTKHKGPRPRT